MDFKKLSINFSTKLAGSLAGGILNFLYSLFLMRRLGPLYFGQYSFALAWAGLLSVAVEFGMNPIVTRDLSQTPHHGRHYFSVLFRTKFILLLLTGTALTVFAHFLGRTSPLAGLFVAVYLLVIALSLCETIQAFAYAYEKFVFSSWVSVIQKALLVMGGSTALFLGYSVFGVAVLSALGAWTATLIAGAVLYMALRKGSWNPAQGPGPSGKAPRPTRQLLQDSFPLFITGLLGTLYFRIDTVFLGHMTSDVETGLYNSAYRFLEISNVLPSVLMAVSQATLAKEALRGHFQSSFRHYAKITLGLSLGALAVLQLASFIVPTILVNPGYANSAHLIRILSITVVPLYANYLFLTGLTILNRQRQIALISGLGAVFNIAINWVIIPRWKSTGAAVTTVASEFFVMILYWWVLRGSSGFSDVEARATDI